MTSTTPKKIQPVIPSLNDRAFEELKGARVPVR